MICRGLSLLYERVVSVKKTSIFDNKRQCQSEENWTCRDVERQRGGGGKGLLLEIEKTFQSAVVHLAPFQSKAVDGHLFFFFLIPEAKRCSLDLTRHVIFILH